MRPHSERDRTTAEETQAALRESIEAVKRMTAELEGLVELDRNARLSGRASLAGMRSRS